MSAARITQNLQLDEGNLYQEALELRRSILCIICLEVYCDPVILPCRHTFCRHCITDSRIKLKCPICSSTFAKRGIIPGTHIRKVVDNITLLVDSLTNTMRYSLPLHILDEQYQVRASHSVFSRTVSTFKPEPHVLLGVEPYDEPIVSMDTPKVLNSIESTPQRGEPPIVFDMISVIISDTIDNDNVDVIEGCSERKETMAVGELEDTMGQGNTAILGAILSVSPVIEQKVVGSFRPGERVQVTPRTWPGMWLRLL